MVDSTWESNCVINVPEGNCQFAMKGSAMQTVSIELPPIETEKTVDVSVSVNGHRRLLNYRVEVFRWDEWWRPPEPRANSLKRMIATYGGDWQLMQIGNPDDFGISIMFKRTH
jgi:hypothetical protein